jgi:hypothetical protein
MAPPKVKNPKRSAQYYRDNPDARKKKAAYDTKYHDNDSRRAYRAELARERRKRGVMGKGGKDMSHTKDGKIVAESASKNRARNRGKK